MSKALSRIFVRDDSEELTSLIIMPSEKGTKQNVVRDEEIVTYLGVVDGVKS